MTTPTCNERASDHERFELYCYSFFQSQKTDSLQQLIAISLLLTVAEKAVEAEALSRSDIDVMRTAVDQVRAAFPVIDGRSEVKRQA